MSNKSKEPNSEWQLAERISNDPFVDEVIRGFVEDQTGDNATMIVREVIRAFKSNDQVKIVLGSNVQQLGKKLTEILKEDQFAECEPLLLKIVVELGNKNQQQQEIDRLTNCLKQIQYDINNDAVAATYQTLGQYRSMLLKIITAYVNASNSTQLDYKYFIREIGEEDWREVTHSDYEASKPDPRTDYKRVAVVQTSTAAPETNATYTSSGDTK